MPRFDPCKTVCDRKTPESLIHNRYYVLARYMRAVRDVCMKEATKLETPTSRPSSAGRRPKSRNER